MSIFGWSLPPGCGTLPGEEDEGPCEVCGNYVDDCICPECKVCGEQGNPACYIGTGRPGYRDDHGMMTNDEQRLAKAERNFIDEVDAEAWEAEAQYWAKEELDTEQYWRDCEAYFKEVK